MNTSWTTATNRRTVLKTGGLLLGLGASSSLLAACGKDTEPSGSSSSAASGSGGDVTLTIMTKPNEVTPELQKQFEDAHKGIKLNIIETDATKLNAMETAGNPPDIVRASGAADTPFVVTRKRALALDDLISQSSILKEDDLDKVNDLFRFENNTQGTGPRYGLVKDYSQDRMYWCNKKLFEQAGVDLPSEDEPLTYTKWLEIASKLTKTEGGTVSVYGLDAFPWNLMDPFMMGLATLGGSVFTDDLKGVDMSTPEGQQMLQFYLDFVKAGVGNNVVQPVQTGGEELFKADRLAMGGYGYWFGGGLIDSPLEEFAFLAPAPIFEGGKRVSPVAGGTGYYISSKTQHPEEAFQFLEWYLGGDPAKERATQGWGIPGLKSLHSSMPQNKPFQKQAFEMQQKELEYFATMTFSPYIQNQALETVFTQAITAGYNGSQSVGQIADAINAAAKPLMEAGVKQAG